MSNNYRPTIDEALESVEKLDNIINMFDYGGARNKFEGEWLWKSRRFM